VDAVPALEAEHIIVGEDFSAAAARRLLAHTNVAAVGGALAILIICTEDVLAGLHCISRPIMKIDEAIIYTDLQYTLTPSQFTHCLR
jgi:hypothetical protein